MTTLVVDASVVIKWVVEEAGTPEALAIQRYGLIAPDLLVAECANILWKKVRRRELAESEAFLAAGLLARADLELVPMQRLLELATRLATVLDHPAYDCLYLCLAQVRGVDFATADERLCAKMLHRDFPVRVLSLLAAPDFLAAHPKR